MKQHEAVEQVMQELGGYATLGHLYQRVPRLSGWQSESKTPFASIRRIVQQTPCFFRIQPGLWGLADYRPQIAQQFALPLFAAPPQADTYNHSYFQGLLVEVGNWKQFQTCVPSQDKNRAFLNTTLAQVATLPACYEFTYPELTRYARTVDVAWFNERRLPHAFYEVEHTTDMYNSFRKFVALQDFRSTFTIVADKARKAEFESKRQEPAYSAITPLLKFLDYDTLADWHANTSQSLAFAALTP